jgi:alkylation response protein AidB-like acyl-CoA dehydrogenase
MAERAAERAVQIFFSEGFIAEYSIERVSRDVCLFRILEEARSVSGFKAA